MGITYHKLHRLRTRHSWADMADALSQLGGSQDGKSVSRVTLHELAEKPHKRPKPHLATAIDLLHEQTFGSPFPAGANRLLELYRSLSSDDKNANRARQLEHLEAFVEDHLRLYPQQDLFRARIHWLMGNLKEDRMRQYRDQNSSEARQLRNQAIQQYRAAAQLVEANDLHQEAFKLKQNLFACYANLVQPGERAAHGEVRKAIVDSAIVETALKVLDQEPFQWLTARVALMCVSIRQGGNDLAVGRELFERLVQANAAFIDPAYQPAYFLPLSQDLDLRWVMENVLPESAIKQIQRRQQRKR